MRKLISLLMLLMLALTAQADVLEEWSFEGTLGDKIPMKLKFAVNHAEIASGEIYYPNAKHPAPILVVGEIYENGWYVLKEYQDDGVITGILSFKIEGEGLDARITEGTWTNPKTGKAFPMKNFEANEEMIDVPKYFDYEDPQNIGREYSYSIWNEACKSMMGGHVKFRGAGKHKLHFEVCNVPNNIAEGKSDPDRPAVLGDYTYDWFVYNNVNECGYCFSAHFFKKFVVLKTTSDYSTLGCFGAGVAFDGVYIKVKQ